MHEAAEIWLAEERHQLVLFAPVALGLGIAAWFALPSPREWVAAMLLGGALAAFGLLAGGLPRIALSAFGLLFALGVGTAWVRAEQVRAPVVERSWSALMIEATVDRVDARPAEGRTRLLLTDISGLPPGLTARVGIRGNAAESLVPGARVALRASLSPPPGPNIPGGYHFARRAWFDGIGAVGYALSDVTVVAPAPDRPGFVRRFEAFRSALTKRLQDGVGGREGGLAAALVTGDRGGLPDDVTEAMRDSGLAHLISISGLHIAVVVGGVLWGTRRLLAQSERLALGTDIKLIAALAAAVAGIGYTLVAGAEVPTVRSCIAVLIVLVGLALGREAISLRLVAAGAFFILLVRPDFLLGPSFQLSFAAVAAIVALYESPLGRRFNGGKEAGRAARLWHGVLALLATGIAAEIALAPIAFFHFNQMGLYGVAANLAAIPLTSFVILPLLGLSVFLGMVGLAAPVDWLLGHALHLLIRIAEFTAAMPGAVSRLPAAPDWAFAVLILGGVWFCLWQTRRRWFALLPVAIGAIGMTTAQPPDLIVDGEGKHLAVVRDGSVALLRPRAGDYVRSMWADAAGEDTSRDLDAMPNARCTPDSCTAHIMAGGRAWTLLATRSGLLIDRAAFEPACAAADIIVSDRRLPNWCTPRWLKLDRTKLAETGALSIWLSGPRIRSVAEEDGAHSWAR
ncbi:ComEC/Rec2 family competence protein [Sphingosinicella microcystinivorans]|uniref:Competence protein ComEC n=1 Tax=Sphingosinicella microcystinivorans TaxID=335406 RepID=A0AAD1D731_SPHMI|nr:ComEC/Rec2 family competence protein [Sphingosinicella microcystinivorans]RKS91924.1 competence protein ComEC [Sphingosinicella microcystinivorans]BBE34910.1 competence protein ComEC [Sphingosinicella microcystinivorans]